MALHKRALNQNGTPSDAHYLRDLPAGSTQTALGENLRASVVDSTAAKLVASPNRPHGAAIAADSLITDQLRPVSSKQEPTFPNTRQRTATSGRIGRKLIAAYRPPRQLSGAKRATVSGDRRADHGTSNSTPSRPCALAFLLGRSN